MSKVGPGRQATALEGAETGRCNVGQTTDNILDEVAPLVNIVEEAQRGALTGEQAAEAAKAAITLLGNASSDVSREIRRKVILSLNKRVHSLAEDEEIFEGAAPLLLGSIFETKMKAHLESLKCLSTFKDRGDRDQQGFRRGHSQYPPRGGGGQRGRGGAC